MPAYDRDAYAKLRADPEAWDRRKAQIRKNRLDRGETHGGPGARHLIREPAKTKSVAAPKMAPGITLARLMAGR